MIRLEIRKDGRTTGTLKLGDGVHGIGRHESNRIQLDDVEVSRRHARLLIDGDTVVIEDLGSNNGTLIAGTEIDRTTLHAGQMVEVTPFTLAWSDPADGAPVFVVVDGPDVGRRFPLVDDALSIGRGEDQDIVLDDKGASRAHAIVVQHDGAWRVRDAGSANGIFLNGASVRDGTLYVGDTLQVGNSVLRFDDPKGSRRPVDTAVAFAGDEAPTELNTRGSAAETALAMDAAPPDHRPTGVVPADPYPPSAADAPNPVPSDPDNLGLIALVVTVMAIVLFLVLVLALVGPAV